MNKIFLVYGMIESGDDWQLAYMNKPTDSVIAQDIALALPEDWEAECIQGWRIIELEVFQ